MLTPNIYLVRKSSTCSDHNSGGCSETQRTGTRHRQHAERAPEDELQDHLGLIEIVQFVLRQRQIVQIDGADYRPRDQRQEAQEDNDGHKIAGDFVGQLLDGCLGGLRLFDQFDDLRQSGGLAGVGRLDY